VRFHDPTFAAETIAKKSCSFLGELLMVVTILCIRETIVPGTFDDGSYSFIFSSNVSY
jgi:hypothetical protein